MGDNHISIGDDMAGTRTGSGSTTTYTFSWTGANLDAIADAAARRIYATTGNTDYDALTIQQKVNILDGYIAQTLTDIAAAYKRDTDMQAAMMAADAYARSNYGLK